MGKEQTGYRPNPRVAELQSSLIRQMYASAPVGVKPVDLGLGQLPYPLPSFAQNAIIRAMNEGKNLYTPNAGIPELRREIAQDFRANHGVLFDEEQVIVTAGSTEALSVVFTASLDHGDEVLVPAIRYPVYDSNAHIAGAQTKEYALCNDFSIDVDSLLDGITSQTRLVVLNSPSNPTGQVIPRSTLQEIAQGLEQHPNVYVVSDEIYSAFVYGNAEHASISPLLDRTIVIDGLSKRASMTGQRLGWILAPREVIPHAAKVHAATVTCAPSLSQYAALAVLRGECDTDITGFRTDLERKRELMTNLLSTIDGVSFAEPQGAFYCFVDISPFGTSVEVAQRIIKETGVVTIPGVAFGKSGDRYIRLSFAASHSAIAEGVGKMKGVLEAW